MKVAQSDPIMLEEFLADRFPTLTLGTLRRAMIKECALVNGVARQRKWRLRPEDEVTFQPRGVLEVRIEPKPYPLPLLWQDEHAVVIDKPSGIGTIPDTRSNDTALLAGAHHMLGSRPFIVHRLDRGTSGALILARTRAAAKWIGHQFEHRTIKKEYLAVVDGVPDGPGTVEAPIGRIEDADPTFQITPDGLEAITHYEVEEAFGEFALIRAMPRTGRTHQIRAHMAYAGYPLTVDPIYGKRSELRGTDIGIAGDETVVMPRLTLHASRIVFNSPSEEEVDVTAPIPDDFSTLLRVLRKRENHN